MGANHQVSLRYKNRRRNRRKRRRRRRRKRKRKEVAAKEMNELGRRENKNNDMTRGIRKSQLRVESHRAM